MEQNDKIIENNGKRLNLLVDTSAFLTFREIEVRAGVNPLSLLRHYHDIAVFFSSSAAVELMQGEGLSSDVVVMLKNSLNDEQSSISNEKENRFLYNSKDGRIKMIELNKMSKADYGQILLCQNHKRLVLLTNDKKMLKSAASLLDKRIMDVLNLLELMVNTPDEKLRIQWEALKRWYDSNYEYKRPETIVEISDRIKEEKPPYQ